MFQKSQISCAVARVRWLRVVIQAIAGGAIFAVVIGSAILAKEWRSTPPLARVALMPDVSTAHATANVTPVVMNTVSEPGDESFADMNESLSIETSIADSAKAQEKPAASAIDPLLMDPRTRWFNGRPIRPARQMWMVVTGYSPDARSCGDSADGITATLHSVETNGFKLVAADPRVLPYGSMLSVPGYDENLVVPVLDCGGAIKGSRLDLLFPTHEQARAWGKKKVLVTVWEYADGKPAGNPRKLR